jgi:hypothetical protein
MTKCDFCPYAHNKNGKIVCPHNACLLSKNDWYKILEAMKGIK